MLYVLERSHDKLYINIEDYNKDLIKIIMYRLVHSNILENLITLASLSHKFLYLGDEVLISLIPDDIAANNLFNELSLTSKLFLARLPDIPDDTEFQTASQRYISLGKIWVTNSLSTKIDDQYRNIDPISCPLDIFTLFVNSGLYPSRYVSILIDHLDTPQKGDNEIVQKIKVLISAYSNMDQYEDIIYKNGNLELITELQNYKKKNNFDLQEYAKLYNLDGAENISKKELLKNKQYLTDYVIKKFYIKNNTEVITILYKEKYIPADIINIDKYEACYPLLKKLGYKFPNLLFIIVSKIPKEYKNDVNLLEKYIDDNPQWFDYAFITISKKDVSFALENFPALGLYLIGLGYIPLKPDLKNIFKIQREDIWDVALQNGADFDEKVLGSFLSSEINENIILWFEKKLNIIATTKMLKKWKYVPRNINTRAMKDYIRRHGLSF